MICTGWQFHSGCSTRLPFIGVLLTLLQFFKVPRRLLRASLRSFRPPTSAFGQPSQTKYSAVSSQHFWHSGFLSHRPDAFWNSLPDLSRDPVVQSERFNRDFKTHHCENQEKNCNNTITNRSHHTSYVSLHYHVKCRRLKAIMKNKTKHFKKLTTRYDVFVVSDIT